jgi:Cys-rich protein (TIGR01571 family)
MAHTKQTFDEPLFGCFDEWTSCLIVTCVPCGGPIIHGLAVDKAQSKGVVIPVILSACLGPIGAAINRAQVRNAYGVEGNFVGDCCTHLWCGPCAVCQEYRQALRKQGKVL